MKILEEAIARLVVVLFVDYLPIIWRVVHRGSLTREVIFFKNVSSLRREKKEKKKFSTTLLLSEVGTRSRPVHPEFLTVPTPLFGF